MSDDLLHSLQEPLQDELAQAIAIPLNDTLTVLALSFGASLAANAILGYVSD